MCFLIPLIAGWRNWQIYWREPKTFSWFFVTCFRRDFNCLRVCCLDHLILCHCYRIWFFVEYTNWSDMIMYWNAITVMFCSWTPAGCLLYTAAFEFKKHVFRSSSIKCLFLYVCCFKLQKRACKITEDLQSTLDFVCHDREFTRGMKPQNPRTSLFFHSASPINQNIAYELAKMTISAYFCEHVQHQQSNKARNYR